MSADNIDLVDRQILDLLVANGRRSATEIAQVVNLSVPAVKRRIDRLEVTGYILGYTATLDHRKLGHRLEAFSELRFAPGTQVKEIGEAVAGLPELVESFTLAGDPDALVRVRVRDVEHLRDVIDRIRSGNKRKIIGTKTLIVLGSTTGR